QQPGLLDAALGDVDPGDPCLTPGPGEGVQPKVALQVEQVLAGDVTDLVDQQRVEVGLGARLPALDVVELRPHVDRGPFFPEGLVGGDVRVHGGSLAHGARWGEAKSRESEPEEACGSPAEGQTPRSPRPTGRPPPKGTAPARLWRGACGVLGDRG